MPSNYTDNFYLGRTYDHTADTTTEAPYLYNPADLTTHAVVVGMTGSGKTGLCLDLMEEAALHNLPAILIDPKGDITNLLLHFPELLPDDFEPWINVENARRNGQTAGEAAAGTAQLWRDGLAEWDIEPERIQRLKDSVHRTIYTPGSTSGRPISILASLRAPDVPWESHQEALLEQIEGTVTALLGLVGMNNIDPISDPEHILLSRIISDAWQAGKDVDLGELIMQTQNPPFEKIGFFEVEQFFPRKDRISLAMKLNNILASPAFQPWMTGEPLDIQNLLYAPDGRPRHSIFYIAHLEETERMFLVTLLYSAIETWMRGQSGTTNLRALVYFDEIFGYLPPSANPPSKTPMLRMLKQARAFGVGLVLATQNPVDIDYKALSNAGTWFIGRLQTERDKMRLLDGLQSAGSDFDRRTADAMLSSLGKRVFLVNNVHSRGGPQLFQTRWAMNYLAGPMTRNQIQDLNKLAGADDGLESMSTATSQNTKSDNAVEAIPIMQQQRATSTSRPTQTAPSPLDDYTKTRAAIPANLEEYYLPRRYSLSRALDQMGWQAEEAKALGLIYQPGLWMQLDAYYTDRSGSFGDDKSYAIYVDNDGLQGRIRFDEYAVPPVDTREFDSSPEPDARFGELPSFLNNARQAKAQSKLYIDHIYRTASIELYENKKLKLVSQPNESLEKFCELCEDEADKYEDAEIEKIQRRFRDKMDRTQDKLRKEERELNDDEARLSSLKMETMVNYGETLVNIASRFFGGSRRRSLGVSSSLRKRRMREDAEADVEESIEEIAELKRELEALAMQQEDELEAIDLKWAEIVAQIDTKKVSPMKKNIAISVLGVVWQPHWLVNLGGRVRLVAAG